MGLDLRLRWLESLLVVLVEGDQFVGSAAHLIQRMA